MDFAPLPNGGRLRFTDRGSGAPLVLVSGLGGLASFWDGFAEDCADKFRVIRYDHQGMGGSTPLHGPTSIVEMAADLLALLDHLDLECVAMVGQSTGGAIAQVLAADHPARVSRLVLCATFAEPCAYMRRLFAGRIEILDGLGLDAYRRHAALILNPPDWIAAHDGDLEDDLLQIAASEKPGDAETIRRRIEAVLAHDATRELARIACPTLVVVAADDMVTPPHHSRFLAGAIPDARLVVLPSGGHCAVRTAPEPYREAVLPFLAMSAARMRP